MASFWITKEMALEALKMSKDTFICIDGNSEVINGKEYTVTTINVCGKKKILKREFKKLQLANGDDYVY
jgi:hypothetical protein